MDGENGETIYGSTSGNVVTASWGTTTRKGNMLYVHLLADKMPQFVTLPLTEKVVSATLFASGEKVNGRKLMEELSCIPRLWNRRQIVS